MIVVTQYGYTQLKKRDSYANNRHAIGIELDTQTQLTTIVEYIWFSQKSQTSISLKIPNQNENISIVHWQVKKVEYFLKVIGVTCTINNRTC